MVNSVARLALLKPYRLTLNTTNRTLVGCCVAWDIIDDRLGEMLGLNLSKYEWAVAQYKLEKKIDMEEVNQDNQEIQALNSSPFEVRNYYCYCSIFQFFSFYTRQEQRMRRQESQGDQSLSSLQNVSISSQHSSMVEKSVEVIQVQIQ
eukprot:TRINITY_DN39053_c0_g1_i1.p2 TRINITY_DN39053_c0_g1~~TRINITY_DN39053_c0_g1_i1.p2  ORF type:complete len:148 (+),score=5.24 TRINITY_DN39053_c0_g1_i1:148-591(+)